MAKTIKTHVSDGSTTIYTFEFEYISKAFVKVLIDGTYTTAFTLSNTFQVTLDAAPKNGAVIVIKRETDQDRLVEFVDGSVLIAKDLNVASLQALHIAAEAFDAASGSLLLDDSGAFSAGGRRITKLGDPVDGQDVVNKQWVEQSGTSFVNDTTALKNSAETAKTEAEAAKTRAVDAETNAAASATASAQSASQAAADVVTANAHKVAAETAQQGAASSLTSVQQIETQIGDLRADGAAAVAECTRLEGLSDDHETAAKASAAAAAQSAIDAANAAGFDPAAFAAAVHTHVWGDITDKPSAFPPTTHTHDWSSITGKPATYPASTHANKLTNARSISLTGAVVGSVSFDGSSDVSIEATLQSPSSFTVTGDVSVQRDLYVGKNGGGDSKILFFDDNSNTLRTFMWDDSINDWSVEDNGGSMRRLFHEGHKPNWNEIDSRPNFSVSTSNPSGGKDGDFWFKV